MNDTVEDVTRTCCDRQQFNACHPSIIHPFFCYLFRFISRRFQQFRSIWREWSTYYWIMKCWIRERKRPRAIWGNKESIGWGDWRTPRVCSRKTYLGTWLETRGYRIQNRINNYSTGSFGIFYRQKVCVGSVTQQAPLCARKNWRVFLARSHPHTRTGQTEVR